MILLIGQCAREHLDREAFQEIDYRRMFGQMAKWVAQIDDPRRIPEYMSHAFHTATSGRPGPVVLSLPEDVLSEACPVVPGVPAYHRVAASPSAAQIEQLRQLLEGAKRPMVIAGGSGWTPAACADLQRFVENWKLPIGLAFRFQDTLDNDHPNYAGDVGLGINPALAERIRDADLLLALGPRLGESTTGGYTLLDIPKTKQTLVHVHQGAEELGRVYAADLPIVSGMPELAAMLAALQPAGQPAWAGARGRGTPRLSRMAHATPDSRRRADGRGDPATTRAPARRRDRNQWRGQLRHVAASAFLVSTFPLAACADQRRDGLWRAGGDCGEVALSRSARSLRWRATAAS